MRYKIDWDFGNPFYILISTVLSQRTRDENTHFAAEALFSRFKNPAQLASARLSEIKRLIKPAGFYRVKAERIREISRIIIERFGGEVPAEMDKLLSLPGVGRKTANCVLVYGFGKPAIPVDTHVHRICNRLGIVRTKTPHQTEDALKVTIPERYWIQLNELLVKFGKEICRPQRPLCKICMISDLCQKREVRGKISEIVSQKLEEKIRD